MSIYRNVLVAVDLGEYSGDLIARAKALAAEPAGVHIAYVQEQLISVYAGASPMGSALGEAQDFEGKLSRALRQRLIDQGKTHDIPPEQLHFLNGKPAHILEEFAKDQTVDLLVLGASNRKGLQRLLGSTANAIVQRAPCDVLVVRAHS